MPHPKVSLPIALPEALRHRGSSVSPIEGRRASGLLLRGVVISTYSADEKPARSDLSTCTGVMCDVLVVSNRYVTVMRSVPVLTQSQGYDDHELWRPQPATFTLSGAPLNIDPSNSRTASDPMDTDGDHVVVGFLGDDLHQPVILGQISHPSATRRPTSSDVHRWRRYVSGGMIGIAATGRVDVVPKASQDMRVTLSGAAKLEATSGGTTQEVMLGRSLAIDLVAALNELVATLLAIEAAVPMLPIATPNLLTLISRLNQSIASQAPYLATRIKAE